MKAKAKYLDKEVEFEGKVIDDKTIIPILYLKSWQMTIVWITVI